MFSNEQFTENVKDSVNKENEESAKNEDPLYQKESFESKISKDDDTNLHIDGLENKMNIDDSEDLSKNINLDEDAQTNTLEKKQSNRKINLFTLGNIIFLVLDVCLPAWDIISDVMVIINYWKRSNFTWVKNLIFSEAA